MIRNTTNSWRSFKISIFIVWSVTRKLQTLTLKLFLFFCRTARSCGEIATTILRQLNPHLLFISFAESVEFDHSFLLDLLISSETQFLGYLVTYLHFVIGGWSSFVQCLVEYRERISCTAEEGKNDDVAMCSVSLKPWPKEVASTRNFSWRCLHLY